MLRRKSILHKLETLSARRQLDDSGLVNNGDVIRIPAIRIPAVCERCRSSYLSVVVPEVEENYSEKSS